MRDRQAWLRAHPVQRVVFMLVTFLFVYVVFGGLVADDWSSDEITSQAVKGLLTGSLVTAFLMWTERRKDASAGADGA